MTPEQLDTLAADMANSTAPRWAIWNYETGQWNQLRPEVAPGDWLSGHDYGPLARRANDAEAMVTALRERLADLTSTVERYLWDGDTNAGGDDGFLADGIRRACDTLKDDSTATVAAQHDAEQQAIGAAKERERSRRLERRDTARWLREEYVVMAELTGDAKEAVLTLANRLEDSADAD